MKKKTIKQLGFLPLLLSLCLFLSSCGSSGVPSSPPSNTATPDPSASALPYTELDILDMAGRKNTIPATVQRIYCNNAAASLFVYAIAPDKLMGWGEPLSDSQKAFLPAPYNALPVFNAENEGGLKALQKAQPEICIFAAATMDIKTKESADQLQKKLGIPVLVIGSSLQSTGLSFGFLGAALEEKEAGAPLSSYADSLMKTIRRIEPPSDKHPTLYVGTGASPLDTKASPSSYGEILDLLHISDVIQTADSSPAVSVSLDQLAKWNPQIMILAGEAKEAVSGYDVAAKAMENPDFSSIQAVKDKQVYGIPHVPFSWIDTPAGPNRLLGLQWLGQLVYPQVFKGDMKAEAKNFYKLFYHVELKDDQLETIFPGIK